MRRLRHGELQGIIDEFLKLNCPYAEVTVEGIESKFLKKGLSRKIKEMELDDKIELVVLADFVRLHNKDASFVSENGKISIRFPKIIR
jgi:hypothetical protein